MKMKILYLSSWKIGNFGKGEVNFVYDQIESISREVEAIFIEFAFVNYFKWVLLWLMNKTINRIERLWDAKKVKAYLIHLPKPSTRLTQRTTLRETEKASHRLTTIILKLFGKPDIIHVHTILPGALIVQDISDKLKIPLVIQEHSGPFTIHINTQEKMAYVKKILSNASLILAVSEFLKCKILEKFPQFEHKIAVIPNLVKTDIFKPSTSKSKTNNGKCKLITITNAQPIKGFDILLQTLNILKEKYFGFSIEIIGIRNVNGQLKNQINALDLNDNILIIGPLSKSQIVKRFHGSDIYVCTSYEETFGLAPAEAIASGLPVVMTNCGGPNEYMNQELGIKISNHDPNNIAEQIISISSRLSDFDKQKMFKSIDSRFNSTLYNRRLLYHYRQLLNGQD